MSLERTMDWQSFLGEGTGDGEASPAPLESPFKLANADVLLELEGTATWDPVGQRVTVLKLEGTLAAEIHLESEGAPPTEVSVEFSMEIVVENEVVDSAR